MNSLDINELKQLLPHDYPFLLIDRVTDYCIGDYIHGFKNITFNEPQFSGHFPQRPIMPGVMIIEAMAQISGILAMRSLPDFENNIFFLASVDAAKFKKVVVPGDQLMLTATVVKKKSKIWKFCCQSFVADKLACSAEIMIAKE